MESICPSGADDFRARDIFLKTWRQSPYDLVWFAKRHVRDVTTVFDKLSAGKPPVEGNPIDFLQKCKDGTVPVDEFERVGAAMAIHYIIATEEDARRKAANARANAARKESSKEQERLDRLQKREEQRAAEDVACGDGGLCVDFGDEDEEEEEDEVDFSVRDEMDVGEEQAHFFEGVDLTRIDWDAEYIQAFLNIDTSLGLVGKRPESGRVVCIYVDEGISVFITKGEKRADALAKILCIK